MAHRSYDSLYVGSLSLTEGMSQTMPSSSPNLASPRSISFIRGQRGPYSRTSVLENERYSPYARKPMQISAKRISNDEMPIRQLTSTAERIINAITKNTPPVVDTKRSPESIKSLKPEFPNRSRSGPPTSRLALDASPARCIMSPRIGTNTPTTTSIAAVGDKATDHGKALLDELFPPVTKDGLIELSADSSEKNNSSEDGISESSSEFFDASGNLNVENIRFEGWTLDKYNTGNTEEDPEKLLDSSSEDEDGNPYIQQGPPPKETTAGTNQRDDSVKPQVSSPVVIADTNTQLEKWECPTCMVQSEGSVTVCPCCETPNPNSKSESSADPISKVDILKPSEFQFGFKGDIPPPLTSTHSGFKFGETSSGSNLLTNFKLGFGQAGDNKPKDILSEKTGFSFGFGNSAIMVPKVQTSPQSSQILDFANQSAKESTWECPGCMVFNKSSCSKCPCCQELRPQTEAKPVEIGSTPMASKSPIAQAEQSTLKRKMVFGIQPEDEEEPLEKIPAQAPTKSNPFAGVSLGLTPVSNEWKCLQCTKMNLPTADRCTGCQGAKPHFFFGTNNLEPSKREDIEKYAFEPFRGIDQTGKNDAIKSDSTSMFRQPPATSAFQTPTSSMFGVPGPGSTFTFGTPLNASSTPFKFGQTSPSTSEGTKRKADPESDTGNSPGFNFGSSEPKLKLRASGTETPTPTPAPVLKSGSVLDALKQPGFGTSTSLPTTTTSGVPAPSEPFTFGNIQSSTTQAPSPSVFQFGTPAANTTTQAPGGFSFGSSTVPVFGFGSTPTQPATQGGFQLQQPGMSTPVQQMAPFVPPSLPNFNMTPNLNFGTPPPADGGNAPFTFQATQSGDAVPQRRIRKAIRRNR